MSLKFVRILSVLTAAAVCTAMLPACSDNPSEIIRKKYESGEKYKNAKERIEKINYDDLYREDAEAAILCGDLKVMKKMKKHGFFAWENLMWIPANTDEYPYPEVLKFLVKNGADVNATDKDGKTVLHVAARGKNLDVVKFLVGNGADVNAKDEYGYGKTPYDRCYNKDSDVAKYLKSKMSGN